MRARDIGEFGMIERIRTLFRSAPDIPVWIGDDSAVVRPFEGDTLITTDSMVEGVHFLSPWDAYFELGQKLVVAGCSDISAMGGLARYFLLTLVIPAETNLDVLERFLRGIAKKSEELGIYIIGGNISGGERIEAHITVLGETKKPITRSGARVGDIIYVTGKLGGTRAGLEILMNPKIDLDERIKKGLVARFLNTSGQIFTGKKLAETGCVSAMIDISDGLIADINHIIELSGVGAVLDLKRIPIYEGVIEYCARVGKNPSLFASVSGEEYELLFTVRGDCEKEFLQHLRDFDCPITRIGHIKRGSGLEGIEGVEGGGFVHW